MRFFFIDAFWVKNDALALNKLFCFFIEVIESRINFIVALSKVSLLGSSPADGKGEVISMFYFSQKKMNERQR